MTFPHTRGVMSIEIGVGLLALQKFRHSLDITLRWSASGWQSIFYRHIALLEQGD